jgi:peptidase M28-like protein
MKRFFKITGLIVVTLVVVIAISVFVGLRKFKNFPEVAVKQERIVSDSKELVNHIRDIVSYGVRNPGTEGDIKTREFILKKFGEYGLQNPKQDEFAIKMYHPKSWGLSVTDPSSKQTIEIPSGYMPFTSATSPSGVTAPLVYIGDGKKLAEMDLEGMIAVYEMPFRPKGLKTYSKILFMYDPESTLDSSAKVVRAKLEYETQMYEKLKAKGAIGMIGLLSGLQWDSDQYYPQMSFGLEKSLPGVWIKPSMCNRVRQLAENNIVANLKMDSTQNMGTTANVYAVLPGQIDEYYLVFSQHDTYFDGAVQDASGVAVLLALAKHFASTGQALKRGIVFMSVAHTNGREGEKNFIKNHKNDFLGKTALVIAIEHLGLELDPRADLTFQVSNRPSFRMFFTALNSNINGMVKSAVISNDYKRSVIIPQWLVEKITGKSRGISAEFHEFGLPVIGFMSNPPYMFFPEDTEKAVAVDQLLPTADVIASILRSSDGFSLNELR